ncbi:iron-containing alcohol dehydrogenase [Blautia schinkii]|nr:iron-containing alcohol dehydrogenase [Blautia schinkii]
MEKFEIKTSIRFGEGALESLREIEGNKIFIVTDPFMVKSGMIEMVTRHLAGKQYKVFDEVEPDPSVELVTKGVKELLEFEPDAAVALGGGSAIDEAKAILHFAGRMGKLPRIGLTAIPTTSGTGSEVTSFAVITDRDKGVKYPLVDASLLPECAILDVDLVKTVPQSVVADTGMDVLTHALEAYVSVRANAFTDALAEKAVVTVFKYLVRSFKDGDDREAREQMHDASCMAGLAFDRTSLGLNHAIAHNIGGKLGVPHGRTNAILLPYVIEFNAELGDFGKKEFNRAAEKYAVLAELVGVGSGNVRAGVKNLIRLIRRMQAQMKMPGSFKECGIIPDKYREAEDDIAKGALLDQCIVTNPRVVTKEDVVEILKKTYHGQHQSS